MPADVIADVDDVHQVLSRYVDSGKVPGLVALVSVADDVHVECLGLERDAIFRIASLTKPIAAAAAMILVEDGRLQLDEPVDSLLPELANPRVLTRLDGPIDDTVPARRPITLRDLLTMRLGFGFIVEPGEFPVFAAATELQVAPGPPKPRTPHPPDEWIRRFATLPLMHQPGEAWMYDTAFSVLGVLVARASGQPLEAFLRDRIFEPLGMRDTGFHVPAAKLDRLPPAYAPDADSGELVLFDDVDDSQWREPPAFPDTTGGLLSTVDDYFAFARMVAGRDERVLTRPSIDAMSTDHLTADQKAAAKGFLDDRGWGFGMSVGNGQVGWAGGLGTAWFSDAEHDLIGILMTQRALFPHPTSIISDFEAAAHGLASSR